MKLAGLDLYEISSGKRKGQRRILQEGQKSPEKNPVLCGYPNDQKKWDHV